MTTGLTGFTPAALRLDAEFTDNATGQPVTIPIVGWAVIGDDHGGSTVEPVALVPDDGATVLLRDLQDGPMPWTFLRVTRPTRTVTRTAKESR